MANQPSCVIALPEGHATAEICDTSENGRGLIITDATCRTLFLTLGNARGLFGALRELDNEGWLE